MGFFSDFKTFLAQGNAMDLAVGVIIGASFGKIVSSLVDNLLMPPLGLIMGQVNFSELVLTLKPATTLPDGTPITAVVMKYGAFMQSVVDFVLIAFCVFLLIKAINTMRKPAAAVVDTPAAASDEVLLLKEIRDLLSAQKSLSRM